MWVTSSGGMVPVTRAPEPHDTHPVRLIVSTWIGQDESDVQEHAFTDEDAANTWLDDLGTRVEDISLYFVVGLRPRDLGFAEAY